MGVGKFYSQNNLRVYQPVVFQKSLVDGISKWWTVSKRKMLYFYQMCVVDFTVFCEQAKNIINGSVTVGLFECFYD